MAVELLNIQNQSKWIRWADFRLTQYQDIEKWEIV